MDVRLSSAAEQVADVLWAEYERTMTHPASYTTYPPRRRVIRQCISAISNEVNGHPVGFLGLDGKTEIERLGARMCGELDRRTPPPVSDVKAVRRSQFLHWLADARRIGYGVHSNDLR